MGEGGAMDYKDTLNLPKTEFPMKAELTKKEPKLLEKWERERIYERMLEQREMAPSFLLHDGPPYANGHIHMGTALNKILKDFIVKSKTMAGFKVLFVPGWDCHGLPIEHEVEKMLGGNKGKLSKVEIRGLCRDYAIKFVNIQREEFKRLGVFGTWDTPYLTMDPQYQAVIIREFGKFVREGYVYRGKKPVYWCPHCKTALAEAEVEYNPHKAPSIFVKFPLIKDERFSSLLSDPRESFIIIWTTTPWTLPANLAIAVNPDYEYVFVSRGNELLLMAHRLFPYVMDLLGEKWEVIHKVEGRELEGLKYQHPFLQREGTVILADYVTLDTGSGCVHIAPGHGEEDYESGLKYGLDIYAPVDESGRFTQEVPEFQGQFVFEADPHIINLLKEKGFLLHASQVEHSYPYCWRCKNPIIFRATYQWFISLEHNNLRQKLLQWIDKVKWIPSWGRERIYNMVLTRPDWCISRQRAWGVPIVAFYCNNCGEILLSDKVIEHVASLVEKEGADIWFLWEEKKLLPPDTRCEKCGGTSFRKEEDIIDVWFDSGVSWAALLEKKRLGFPADLYLEGSDQHRGWFQSSLICSVANRGMAPYKSVLTHGFVVDGEGRKMSKSLGNVISPSEIIDEYGAEILRLWACAEDYKEDIRISGEIIQRLVDAYRRIRNTWRFMLGNLYDFDPQRHRVPYSQLWEIDKWILSRFMRLTKRIREAYDNYSFHIIYHSVHTFSSVDLSALYLDILKERLYVLNADHPKRRSAQSAIYEILKGMIVLMAPILSFTSEEAWSHLPKVEGDPESVHLASFPKVRDEWINEELELRWERLLRIREEVNRALEEARRRKEIGHSFDALVKIEAPSEEIEFLRSFGEELREVLIVSQVELGEASSLSIRVFKAKGKKCPRCWVYDEKVGLSPSYPELCPRCVEVLLKG
jgi:isoleucyl-tRNA synthetase